MDHPHAASLVAAFGAWVPLVAGLVGAGVAIFAGIWSTRRPRATRGFDFAASARRIRAMPTPPRHDA